jgi:hypothetical protein
MNKAKETEEMATATEQATATEVATQDENTQLSQEDLQKHLDQIKQHISNIKDSLLEMSKLMVIVIDGAPDGKGKLVEASGLALQTINAFEKIGRGQVDERLSPLSEIQSANLLRRLPISDQRKALSGPLELLTAKGDKILLQWENGEYDQHKQLVSPCGIRSLAQQRAYLESRQKLPKTPQPEGTVAVVKGKLVFSGESTWDPVDLIEYATEVMRSKRKSKRVGG